MNSPALKLERENETERMRLAELHPEFFESLKGLDMHIHGQLEDRKYQARALACIRDRFLSGDEAGQLIMGTGGGKTTVAFQLAQKVKGRVLWIAPSTTAINRAIDEIFKVGSNKKWALLDKHNFKSIKKGETEIVFATSAMLMANDKFSEFCPTHFSLMISDEAHHMMGKKTRELLDHFQAFKLFMTATPETTVGHLDDFAKPFFHYSSEDLIRNDNFPFWVMKRYEVINEKIYEAKTFGDNYKLDEGEEGVLLDMPARFSHAKKILRETVTAGEKTMVFLPSVKSSREFVEKMLADDPILQGKVAHVDGSSKNRTEVEEKFKRGEILAVCCKDLWSESLDVRDIKHIVLGDPCSSMRVLMQRIGRGARPVEGKTHLTIHDIVSVVDNIEAIKNKVLPLTVAGAMGVAKAKDGLILNGPTKGHSIYEDNENGEDKKVVYLDRTKHQVTEIPFFERLIDMSFMANPETAVALYWKMAEVLKIEWVNLVLFPRQYFNSPERVRLKYSTGRTVEISFKDIYDSAKVYGSLEYILETAKKGLENPELVSAQIKRKILASTAGRNKENSTLWQGIMSKAVLKDLGPELDPTSYPPYIENFSPTTFKLVSATFMERMVIPLMSMVSQHSFLNKDRELVMAFSDRQLEELIGPEMIQWLSDNKVTLEKILALNLLEAKRTDEGQLEINISKSQEHWKEAKKAWPVKKEHGIFLGIPKNYRELVKKHGVSPLSEKTLRLFYENTQDQENPELGALGWDEEKQDSDFAVMFAYLSDKYKGEIVEKLILRLINSKRAGRSHIFLEKNLFVDNPGLVADFVFAMRGSLDYETEWTQGWKFPLFYSVIAGGYFMPIDQIKIKWLPAESPYIEDEPSKKRKDFPNLSSSQYEKLMESKLGHETGVNTRGEIFSGFYEYLYIRLNQIYSPDFGEKTFKLEIHEEAVRERILQLGVPVEKILALNLIVAKAKGDWTWEIDVERTRIEWLNAQQSYPVSPGKGSEIELIKDSGISGEPSEEVVPFTPKTLELLSRYSPDREVHYDDKTELTDDAAMYAYICKKYPGKFAKELFGLLLQAKKLNKSFIFLKEEWFAKRETAETVIDFVFAMRGSLNCQENFSQPWRFPLFYSNRKASGAGYFFPIDHIKINWVEEERPTLDVALAAEHEKFFKVLKIGEYKKILGKIPDNFVGSYADQVKVGGNEYNEIYAIERLWGSLKGRAAASALTASPIGLELRTRLALNMLVVTLKSSAFGWDSYYNISDEKTRELLARQKSDFEFYHPDNAQMEIALDLSSLGRARFSTKSRRLAKEDKAGTVGFREIDTKVGKKMGMEMDTAAVFLYLIEKYPAVEKYFNRLLESKKRGLDFIFFKKEEMEGTTADLKAITHFVLALRDENNFSNPHPETNQFPFPLYFDEKQGGWFFPIRHIKIVDLSAKIKH